MNSDKPILDVLQKELEYRRTKQWNIFSWCSTLFVAITGGVIALESGEKPHQLQLHQRVTISVAVLGLTAYAFLWLRYNSKQDKRTAERLSKEADWQIRGQQPPFGYRGAIVLLAIAALFATWYPLLAQCFSMH